MSSVPISKRLDLIISALRGADLEAVEIVLTPPDMRRLKRCAGAPIGSLKSGFYRGVQISAAPVPDSAVAVRGQDGMIERAPIRPRLFAEWLTLPDGWPPLSAPAAKRSAVA